MGKRLLLEYVCNKTASPLAERQPCYIEYMCKSISVYLAFNKLSQQLNPTTEPERNAFTQRVLASTLWHDGFHSQVTDGSSSTAIPHI